MQKKAEQNKDLEKQLTEFSKYTTSESTVKALLELRHYKETSEKQAAIIQDLINQLNKLSQEKELAEQELTTLKQDVEVAIHKASTEEKRRIQAETEKEAAVREKEEIKAELEQQITETLFAKADRGTEKDDLLSIQHHIFRHSAQHITNYIESLVSAINADKPKDELLQIASKISFENKKVITLSRFVTKAQFDTTVSKIKADLISFVNEYVLNVYQEYKHLMMNNQSIRISANKLESSNFSFSFRPIEVIIILDNLLNNSLKAKSKNVSVIWENQTDSEIELHVIDDGIGISDSNKERIFDPRFTTTNGSGLGLYHTKEVIEKMGGSITVNNKLEKGVEFILKFKK